MTGISRILPLISSGDSSAVNTLAEQGFFDSITTEEKRQLVFTAAQNGQAGMLRFLFEAHHLYSPDPDNQGQTLLHQAAKSGDAETVRFAMEILGFDPLQGDLYGVTPLDLARAAKKQEAVRAQVTLEEHMRQYLETGMDRKEAMKAVAKDRGLTKREVYAQLLGED